MRETWAEQPWDRTATSVSPFAYVGRGRYADYLAPWVATFRTPPTCSSLR